MGPRYTKAIIMLVVGSPVLAAGIIIDNSLEANTARSSTVTIARLMIAAGACMVAVGFFICCIILTTSKKEDPNTPSPASDVQLHRVRVTTAPSTQPGRRGIQLVTYSPLPETQNVSYPQSARFNRNPTVNSNAVHFQSNAVSNTPSSKSNPHPVGNPSAGAIVNHPPIFSPNHNGGQHPNPPQNPAAATHCLNASVSETKSQKSNTSEAKSQKSNTSATKSQHSNTSEAKSQHSRGSERKGHRVTICEEKNMRSSVTDAKTQRSSSSEAKNRRSNTSETKNLQASIPEAKCHRSKKSDAKSQCSSSSDSKSHRSNPSSPSKRPPTSGNPNKRGSNSDSTSPNLHNSASPPQKNSHRRHLSSESLVYPVNAMDMAKLLTAAKKVMDPKTFDDIAKTYSIVYSSSGSNSQAELSSDNPIQGPVSSCSSSTGQLSSHSAGAISLPKQAGNQMALEASNQLGNSPSAPPYQEELPEIDPPPYHP